MIRKLAGVFSSKWTVGAVAVVWVFSLGWMLANGVEEFETFPNGEWEHRPYVIQRTPTFVFISLVLIGYGAIWFKQKFLGYYGLFEVAAGLVGGYATLENLPLNQGRSWLLAAAAGFVVVRGTENISKSLEQPNLPNPQFTKDDPQSPPALP